ncbi:hypothetical protein BU25DRAFT_273426 [Macroventuria anomochaeta]|uniref:Uncharacterized protein n=1 Tax=Macroventuria anomochaeta TaxID=301207 RepID=A0ACB6S8R8_9PLEO|nr:uncharacterized protein BU25DRAFT_273426 [Macroventuria anomochaeta]KAF2629744.1 hypothetical protein BU25DRAFT_273426 [Macroventuria anomochaeta]
MLTGIAVKIEELPEPAVEGIPTIHEMAKKGWTKSKQYVRKTGRALERGFGKWTGLISDTDTNISDNATARRPSEPLKPNPLRKHGVVSRTAATYPGRRKHTTLTPTEMGRLKSESRSGSAHAAPSTSQPAQNGSGVSALSNRNNSINRCISAYPLNMTIAQSQAHVSQQSRATNANLSLRCQICSLWFPGFNSLRKHNEQHHRGQGGSQPAKKDSEVVADPSVGEDADEELFVECKIAGCSETFSSDELRMKHQAGKHLGELEEVFSCRICWANFPNETSWRRHEVAAHPDPEYRP